MGRDVLEERGWGSRTQKFVYQKQPKSIFPFVNFVFSHYETWVQGGRAGVQGGWVPPLLLRSSAVQIHPWLWANLVVFDKRRPTGGWRLAEGGWYPPDARGLQDNPVRPGSPTNESSPPHHGPHTTTPSPFKNPFPITKGWGPG